MEKNEHYTIDISMILLQVSRNKVKWAKFYISSKAVILKSARDSPGIGILFKSNFCGNYNIKLF